MKNVKVGCCGFQMARHEYYRLFPTVEIQQTFYHPPELKTGERWRKESPDGFEFAVKAWQLITHEPTSPTYRRLRFAVPGEKRGRYGHFHQTAEVREAWKRTEDFCKTLGAHLVLFQCPPSFKSTSENIENMRSFFSSIRRQYFTFAWEPRGAWNIDIVNEICESLDLVHVIDPFKEENRSGKICYFRLHGLGGYRTCYSEVDLLSLRAKISDGILSYVFFNNSDMVKNGLKFQEMVEKQPDE